jgi:hypothetical protein
MEKLAYVIRKDAGTPGRELRQALIDDAAPALRKLGAAQLAVSVEDEDVAHGEGVRIRRSEPPIRALMSFWMQNSDDRGPMEALLREQSDGIEGYLVVESRPVVYEPPSGERARGANLVTCVTRKPGLEDDEFFQRWNEEHKRVAVEIQSTFGYIRNAVARCLTPGAPVLDGIVEEAFPIEALSDPLVWYDCDTKEEHQRRVKQMVESVTAFLDLSTLESIPMSQYVLG